MQKKYLLIPTLCLVAVAMSGCTLGSKKDTPMTNNNQVVGVDRYAGWDEQFDQIEYGDLQVGMQVMVTGETQSDGSMVADRVLVGASGADMMRFSAPLAGQDDVPVGEPPADRGNTMFQGERPNMETFQNMSDEEREQFRERMRENMPEGVQSGGGFAGSGMGQARGEVMSIDEQNFTVKLGESGSRLVFINDETKFYQAPEESEAPVNNNQEEESSI